MAGDAIGFGLGNAIDFFGLLALAGHGRNQHMIQPTEFGSEIAPIVGKPLDLMR